ncbi:unnamed protein product, partial [Larinioides sclopetarius]
KGGGMKERRDGRERGMSARVSGPMRKMRSRTPDCSSECSLANPNAITRFLPTIPIRSHQKKCSG